MNLTAYRTKIFVHELTKQSSSDNVNKFASVIRYASKTIEPREKD
jgi:hypothetical protein